MTPIRPLIPANRADRWGRAAETGLLVALLSAMILLAAGQIALRNIGGAGFGWADEALRIMVLWITMIGSVAASRDQRHVRIDALSRYLPARLGRWATVLIDAFAAGVCFVLAWYSYRFAADALAANDRVLGGELPAWTVQSILPAGFAFIGYRFAVACVSSKPARAGDAGIH